MHPTPVLRPFALLGLTLVCVSSLHAQWDPNQTYQLHTELQGSSTALDVIEGGADDKDAVINPLRVHDTGQYWRISRIREINGVTYWRLSNVLFGKDMALDIYNGGTKGNRAQMVPTAPRSGQFFKIEEIPQSGGSYRLTTLYPGPSLSLEGTGGPTNDRPCLKATGNLPGQKWRITPADLPKALLYYKFDRNVGDVAVNYGRDDLIKSTLVNSGSNGPWAAPGRAGAAMLAGSTLNATNDFRYCDTGRTDGFRGDITIHMWVKEATGIPSGLLSYLYGGMGSFRCFTGGLAGNSLWVRSALTGSAFNIVMPTVGDAFQVRARSGMFVSLVVKGLEAQWYVDGATHGPAITLPAPIDVPGNASTFKVGKHTSNFYCSAYDMDEFRLYDRAASPAEIARWSSASPADAAAGAFGDNCGIRLSTIEGPPRVGNTRYTHTISGAPYMRYLFVLGLTTQPGFDMGIVFPALSGCTWRTAFDIEIISSTGGMGRSRLTGSIPNDVALAGVGFDTQVLGFAPPNYSTPNQSKAVSHKIELY